ncbi:transposase, partial [Streptomyces sp. WM6386]
MDLVALTAACPEMTQLAAHIADFAQLLIPREKDADGLSRWIVQVRTTDLPHLDSFARGLDRDRDAVI